MVRITTQELIMTFNIETTVAGENKKNPTTVVRPRHISGETSLQVMDIVVPLIQKLDKEALRRGNSYFNLKRAISKARKNREWDGQFMSDNLFVLYIEDSRVNFRKVAIHERIPNIAGDWNDWLCALCGLERFTQAYICDTEYSRWQNVEDITRFEDANKDHSGYKKIPNNYPPPFDGDMIDITNNPGRIITHDRWIEVVASPMWFGNEFWRYMKHGKKEEIISSSLVNCKEFLNGILEVRALDHCIDETVSPDFQNLLRQLFYDVVPV